jgi:hypothetical protein
MEETPLVQWGYTEGGDSCWGSHGEKAGNFLGDLIEARRQAVIAFLETP